jgi:signal peptidase I
MTGSTQRMPGGFPSRRRARPAPRAAPGPCRRCLRALGAIATVLAAIIAPVAIVIAVATQLSPRGQYVIFGHPVLTVLSGSMTPVIDTGDLIIDDPVTAAQARHLRVGQIITFRAAPGSPVIITHQIVGTKTVHGAVSYITKGAANNAPDTAPRPATDVIGVFRLSIRGGGYLLNALHRPLVFGLLIASPVLWFLAGPLYQLARDMDQRGAHRAENRGRLAGNRGRSAETGTPRRAGCAARHSSHSQGIPD